jgi:hypothetical protein
MTTPFPFFFNLIFTTSSPNASWFSRLISWLFRFFTKGNVSHSAGIFDIYGMRMTIGAESDGVSWIPLSKFVETNKIVYRLSPIPDKIDIDKLESAFIKLMQEYSDAEYDYSSVGVGFIKYVLKPIYWFEQFLSDKKVNCTELYIRYLDYAGFKCVKGLSVETTSAHDLMVACVGSGEFSSISYEFKSKKKG